VVSNFPVVALLRSILTLNFSLCSTGCILYNKVLISSNLFAKSTFQLWCGHGFNNIIMWQDDDNDELLPLMDFPDTFFSKTQFKSIKYFNKSWLFTSKLIPYFLSCIGSSFIFTRSITFPNIWLTHTAIA
jgi:hypothetical protein